MGAREGDEEEMERRVVSRYTQATEEAHIFL